MNDKEKVLLIPKIDEGVVIDHIPAGRGVQVLETIRSYPEMREVVVTLGLNYQSTKMGRKDLLKLQIPHMPERILEHLALISPGMTIKRITNYAVDKKYKLRPPAVIAKLARCRNPNCVTNHERHLQARFRVVDDEGRQYKCTYCERVFLRCELELVVS